MSAAFEVSAVVQRAERSEMIGLQPDPALTVPALLARAVAGHGDRIYAITPTGRLSYRQAEQRSAGLARWMMASGVGKGGRRSSVRSCP